MKVREIQLVSSNLSYSDDVIHAKFPLRSVSAEDPYILKGATGLDAEEIISNYIGSPLPTREKFYSMRPKSRTVVLLIKPNPQYIGLERTVSDLRDALYRAISFSHRGQLELRFIANEEYAEYGIASLFGTITKFEASLFSENPEIQLTLSCEDPFLRGTVYWSLFDRETQPWNGQTYDDAISTAPHGFQMELTVNRRLDSITIRESNQPNDVVFRIDHPFENQDKIYFSSEENNRYLYVAKYGSYFDPNVPITNVWYPDGNGPNLTQTIRHLTDKIASGSVWPITRPGTNLIYVTQGVVVNSIQYRHAYWGV